MFVEKNQLQNSHATAPLKITIFDFHFLCVIAESYHCFHIIHGTVKLPLSSLGVKYSESDHFQNIQYKCFFIAESEKFIIFKALYKIHKNSLIPKFDHG